MCAELAHMQPGHPVTLTLADVLQTHELKSFDYRVSPTGALPGECHVWRGTMWLVHVALVVHCAVALMWCCAAPAPVASNVSIGPVLQFLHGLHLVQDLQQTPQRRLHVCR